MKQLVSAFVILLATSCSTVGTRRSALEDAGVRIEELFHVARQHLAAGKEKDALMALREAAALEAKWDRRTPWTTQQIDDRALLNFASLAIAPVSGAKTDTDREQALDAAERHLDAHPNDAATTPLLIGIARGWFALGKLERAAALFEQAAARRDSSRGIALVGLAEVQERLERPDLSMQALRSATQADHVNTITTVMDADNKNNIAHRWLGRILELRQDWKGALATYEQWRPSTSCGYESVALDNERESGIARTRLQLGDSSALAAYEKQLHDWPADSVGVARLLLFVELAVLARDLPRADAAVQVALRSAQQKGFGDDIKQANRAVDLLRAVKSASGRALLDVVRAELRQSPSNDEPEEAEIVGRILSAVDPSAVEELPSLIAAGDRAAIAISGYVPTITSCQALKERFRLETDVKARESIGRAVRALEYLSVIEP